nr:hypothetical protein [uncultured Haemophilus sp.]
MALIALKEFTIEQIHPANPGDLKKFRLHHGYQASSDYYNLIEALKDLLTVHCPAEVEGVIRELTQNHKAKLRLTFAIRQR